jgi:hypothetical protein
MRPKTRRRFSLAILLPGLTLAALAASAWANWAISCGQPIGLFAFDGMLRLELDIAPASSSAATRFRSHPLEFAAFRSGPGHVIEIGSLPLAAAGLLTCGLGLLIRRVPRPRPGLCPGCAYDLRGLPPGTQACPECGSNPCVPPLRTEQKAH